MNKIRTNLALDSSSHFSTFFACHCPLSFFTKFTNNDIDLFFNLLFFNLLFLFFFSFFILLRIILSILLFLLDVLLLLFWILFRLLFFVLFLFILLLSLLTVSFFFFFLSFLKPFNKCIKSQKFIGLSCSLDHLKKRVVEGNLFGFFLTERTNNCERGGEKERATTITAKCVSCWNVKKVKKEK